MRCTYLLVLASLVVGCSDSPAHVAVDARVVDGSVDASPDAEVDAFPFTACTTVGDAGCTAGQTCVFGLGTGVGYCILKGTAVLGAACTSSAISTGCAEGMCRGGTCVAFCDPFDATAPACPAGKFCSATY